MLTWSQSRTDGKIYFQNLNKCFEIVLEIKFSTSLSESDFHTLVRALFLLHGNVLTPYCCVWPLKVSGMQSEIQRVLCIFEMKFYRCLIKKFVAVIAVEISDFRNRALFHGPCGFQLQNHKTKRIWNAFCLI
jgi:hypothetical protein